MTKTVLVVDDDPVNRLVATLQLRELGAAVTTAENGDEAAVGGGRVSHKKYQKLSRSRARMGWGWFATRTAS